jgi:chemotaxis protein MotB
LKSKKKNRDEASAPNLIQIMTVSLFIILLAFFILLNAIAVVDEKKKRQALGSLMQSFGVLSGGNSVIIGEGDNVGLPPFSIDVGKIDFKDLFIGNKDIAQEIRITCDKKGNVVSIPSRLLFERHSTCLKPSSTALLDNLCKIINKNNCPIEIIGHTDNAGMDEEIGLSDRELSSIRALGLLKYFVSHGKIMPNRITSYGWGKYRPIVSNRTEETREINRRMEILFVHKSPRERPKGIFTFKDFFFKVFD